MSYLLRSRYLLVGESSNSVHWSLTEDAGKRPYHWGRLRIQRVCFIVSPVGLKLLKNILDWSCFSVQIQQRLALKYLSKFVGDDLSLDAFNREHPRLKNLDLFEGLDRMPSEPNWAKL